MLNMDLCHYILKGKYNYAHYGLEQSCDPRDCSLPGSMGFSRQEYWSRLLFPPPGDLFNPRIEPESLASPAIADRFFITSTTWEAMWE